MDNKIKVANPKGNHFWIYIEKTDVEAETLILWPLEAKSQLIGKDHDAGKDWRQKEKGMRENEMAGWYCRLSGHKLKQALGDSEGEESMVCCSP